MKLPRCGKCPGCRAHFGGSEPGSECVLWRREERAPRPRRPYSWPLLVERLQQLEVELEKVRAARH